jgi:hypothetical protein
MAAVPEASAEALLNAFKLAGVGASRVAYVAEREGADIVIT